MTKWDGFCISMQNIIDLCIVPTEMWKEGKAEGDRLQEKVELLHKIMGWIEDTRMDALSKEVYHFRNTRRWAKLLELFENDSLQETKNEVKA